SGIGNLTSLLANKSGFVLAVEKDERYFPILRDVLGGKLQAHNKTPGRGANVKLIFGDAMTLNFQDMLKPGYKVVANIPYYITGKIIEMLLAAKNRPAKIVLLVQKEVAERITSKPGNLSILGISVQLYADAKFVALVPKEYFYPQPEVDSAILVLDMLEKPRIDVDEKKFFRLLKAAFLGKRKQIHNTLENNLKLPESAVLAALKAAKIQPQSRPQELSLSQWEALYKNLAESL
ncbi:16S rRNA (adenine(1518)-N(6)/adenine(1519)-N(6))-dimethyltransferase, partial [Patescibacteria group bacterium]|nr:16S rRNA (adenine(1518)-N(6)/adenine(1519)-N(6))-dimethyltransferase [Patescibacteria group bacterium]